MLLYVTLADNCCLCYFSELLISVAENMLLDYMALIYDYTMFNSCIYDYTKLSIS